MRNPTPWAGQPRAAHTATAFWGDVEPGPQSQPVVDHQLAHAVVEQIGPPSLVAVTQRQLVGRARQVGEQHEAGWPG